LIKKNKATSVPSLNRGTKLKYRKTPLPADKKGLVSEVQQITRRRKLVRKGLEYLKQARAPGMEIAEVG
jgi:hypothetical protein